VVAERREGRTTEGGTSNPCRVREKRRCSYPARKGKGRISTSTCWGRGALCRETHSLSRRKKENSFKLWGLQPRDGEEERKGVRTISFHSWRGRGIVHQRGAAEKKKAGDTRVYVELKRLGKHLREKEGSTGTARRNKFIKPGTHKSFASTLAPGKKKKTLPCHSRERKTSSNCAVIKEKSKKKDEEEKKKGNEPDTALASNYAREKKRFRHIAQRRGMV